MKKYIVTTTINKPTRATMEFCQRSDWMFIIVGDTKTPHPAYQKLTRKYSNVQYLTPEYQQSEYPKLSSHIGWGSIQRRNIGFVEAYKQGADIVATVDDDNIPYNSWGENLSIGKEVEVDVYEASFGIFDPLSVTQSNFVWHRGFPIQYLANRHQVQYKGKRKLTPLIQADLWDGDPDIDALARLAFAPIVKFKEITSPFCSPQISPFNSQNTFLAREVLPYYAVLPHVGRMDDIWGAYIVQNHFPQSVIYNSASVYQDRNSQDLVTNLEKEIFGYRNTVHLLKDLKNYTSYLPPQTLAFWKEYRKMFTL